MLSNYRKTNLNSLLLKRRLCAKNNENNKKNIFTFYKLLKLPGRWFRNTTRSNICPAYFIKHDLAGRPHSSALWDPSSKIIKVHIMLSWTQCLLTEIWVLLSFDSKKERKMQREQARVSFSCQVQHDCRCQGGNFQLPSRLGTFGPQRAISLSGS